MADLNRYRTRVHPAGSAAALFLGCFLLAGCGGSPMEGPVAGDPKRGEKLARRAGCGSCHQLPGEGWAQGRVGPPLGKLRQRVYLAGILPNNFNNLVLWLEQPQEVAPGSAMPNTGLSREEAEDVAAYLYSLD